MSLRYAEACSCRRDQPLCSGDVLKYLASEAEAVVMLVSCYEEERTVGRFLYWSIHVGDKHVVGLDV